MHAKIALPAARLIGRAANLRRVSDSSAQIVWMAAPKGSGKTSLGIEFARSCAGGVAWLRLDEADLDPASFLHYFEQAVGQTAIAPGWQAPPLQAEHLPALQAYIRNTLRTLARHIQSDAGIVLDDAHECQQAPFFRLFLETMAAELPPSVKVLVLSRANPPAEANRLLSHGLMQQLSGEILAFSADETEKLLSLFGIAQAAQQRDAVFKFTLGWAAGVALAASWLTHQPQGLLQTSASAILQPDQPLSQTVASYLAGEVFASYSAAERDALFAVCWLPYFSAVWANDLAGTAAAAQIGQLAAQGALIYSYAGERYSLHPLFQRFLCDKAQHEVDAATRQQWIAQSITLLENDGNVEAAIELALLHQDAPQLTHVAQLIEQRAEQTLAQAQHQTLARWITALPPMQRTPWHHYWLGMAEFMQAPGRARTNLLKAHAGFAAQGNDQHRLLTANWIIQSYFFDNAAAEPLRDFLQRHVDPQKDYQQAGDTTLRANLILSVFSSLAAIDPGHPDLDSWEQRALDALAQAIDPMLKIHIAMQLTQHYASCGRYAHIHAVRQALEALPEARDLPPHLRYYASFVSLMGHMVRFEHQALLQVQRDNENNGGQHETRIMDASYVGLVCISLLLRGETAEIGRQIAHMQTLKLHGDALQTAYQHSLQAWLANSAGDSTQALIHTALLRDTASRLGHVRFELFASIHECIALALRGDAACTTQLQALRSAGEQAAYPVALIHADLIDAWLALRAGDSRRAHELLRAGFERMAQDGSGFLYGGVAPILRPLCAEALRLNFSATLVQKVIRGFHLSPPPDAPTTWPWPVQIRCFGNFELLLDGAPLPSSGKSKHRQLELLKLLAAHAPLPLTLTKVAELLWPDAEGDAAHGVLETTLSRLRSTFGSALFHTAHGAIELNRAHCWTDTAALDHTLQSLEKLIEASADATAAAPTIDANSAAIATTANAVLGLYRGELLGDDAQSGWFLLRREFWRSRIRRDIGLGAARLAHLQQADAAAALLRRALETDPTCETLVTDLMRLQLQRGQQADGLAAYQRYCRMVEQTSHAARSRQIDALAEQLAAPLN